MRKDLGLVLFGALILGSSAVSQPVIEHRAVACAVAEKFPRLEATFSPPEAVAKARVLFQGANPLEWFAVDMKQEGSRFVGVLPMPRKSLKSFRYYIEVTDTAIGTNRTEEHTTSVVGSGGECQGIMAIALNVASIVLQVPAGALSVPAGFSGAGVIAGSAAGGAVGAASAGASGGIGGTALVVGGLAAAGGAVALAAPKGSGDQSSTSPGSSPSTGSGGGSAATPSPTFSPTPPSPGATPSPTPSSMTAFYSVAFMPSPPGLDVSACAGRPLTWISQAVGGVATDGTFNLTWSPMEPNTVRIVGQVTATTFQATLTCTNGSLNGSISASGSNGNYSGSFDFGSSRGQVTVTRRE